MSLRQRDCFDFRTGGFDGPPDPFEFDKGGHGHFPRWATYVITFLSGVLLANLFLFVPIYLPVLAVMALVTLVGFAYRRRWR